MSIQRSLALGILGVAFASACSGADEQSFEQLDTAKQEIIDGFPVKTFLADAVGALGVYNPDSSDRYKEFFPVCTATLISRNSVLTAKHCIELASEGYDLAFGIGYDGDRPKKVVPIVSVEGAPGDGNLSFFGWDIGIGHLDRNVSGVRPLPLGTLSDAHVGKKFVIAGYGFQQTDGAVGTRHAGFAELRAREGRVMEMLYGSVDALYEAHVGEPAPTDCSCEDEGTHDSEEDPCALYCELAAEFELELAKEYEVLVGRPEGDAKVCYGDSGGPLLGLDRGQVAVFGVASTSFGIGDGICEHDLGTLYMTFGPEVRDFIEQSTD